MKARPAPPAHRAADVVGVVLLGFAVLLVYGLLAGDSGLVGRALTRALRFFFGGGAWAVPPLVAFTGVALLRGRQLQLGHLAGGLTLLFVAVLGGVAGTAGSDWFDPTAVSATGGYVGAVLGWLFASLFGAAKNLGLGVLGVIGLVLCVDVPIRAMLRDAAARAAAVAPKRAPRQEELPRAQKGRRKEPHSVGRAVVLDSTAIALPEARKPRDPEPELFVEPEPEIVAPAPKKSRITVAEIAKKEEPEFVPIAEITDEELEHEGYQLPSPSLLNEPKTPEVRDPVEMQRQIDILVGTLDQFGIEAHVAEVAAGPTITRYEIQLGAGVKVSRITSLADNIAMDLAASQVRVEAPIPGKAAIGVEVPNPKPVMVTLRELTDRDEFRNHPSRLAFALGKDVSGKPRYADLTRMPHLLIGGATNSGKSIGLATLITSLLVRNSPKDLRMVMIDPKRVELTLFDRIPHLLYPVVKDTSEAAGLLAAVKAEMDRRYDLLSERGVRNIDGWNEIATFHERLPYIVVVIDELADLMIQHRAEVETVIVRLAQLARAVGIHMVLATQRPSVDVITGLIKANIPSRIAFSVASAIDSRTILDAKGAEALIGKGDMLYSPIDANKPMRVQGCYVSEKEIDAVCKHWRSQQAPDFALQPVAAPGTADAKKEGGEGDDERDPLWEDAVRWTVDAGKVSTSNLQRKFGIGFQRASRILDAMETAGIVSAQNGPRPREVLVTSLDVDGMFGTAPAYEIGATLDDE